MSDQSWLSSSGNVAAGDAPVLQPYELRPLNTGEVLDRTFQIFRKRFWLFAGLAAIPSAILVTLDSVSNLVAPAFKNGALAHLSVNALLVLGGVFFLVYLLVALVLYSLLNAATTWAVSKAYLGEEATIGKAISSISGKWFRYCVLAIAQFWSGFWPVLVPYVLVIVVVLSKSMLGNIVMVIGAVIGGLLVFAGSIFSVIFFLRVSLAFPASVIEDLKVRASLRRSKQLLVTRKGRIFLLYLFVFAIAMVIYMVGMLVLIPLMLPFITQAINNPNTPVHPSIMTTLAESLVGFVMRVLIGPIATIGLCLFYLDERVRREGFDIEFLMDKAQLPEVAPAPEA